MTESFAWEKLEFANYTTPDMRRVRAILCDAGDGKFAYEWEGTTKDGKTVDIVAFIERGWRPVLALNDNCRGTFFVYTGVLVRDEDNSIMDVQSFNVCGDVVQTVAMSDRWASARCFNEL